MCKIYHTVCSTTVIHFVHLLPVPSSFMLPKLGTVLINLPQCLLTMGNLAAVPWNFFTCNLQIFFMAAFHGITVILIVQQAAASHVLSSLSRCRLLVLLQLGTNCRTQLAELAGTSGWLRGTYCLSLQWKVPSFLFTAFLSVYVAYM